MGQFIKIEMLVVVFAILLSQPSLVHAESLVPHVEQEIIVRFKSGFSPDELAQKVAERKRKGEIFVVGPIQIWFENIKMALARHEMPEVHLSTIQSVENSIAVSDKEILFQDEGVPNIYLVKYTSQENIQRVVKMFQSLPEVEFAEPNYMYDNIGI